jgi:gluconokinase
MIILVMGVSGAGKTTVGRLLASALGFEFVDADTLHPPQNVAKMARGEPLDDADREPWLEALTLAIQRWLGEKRNVVLACSALKEAYRRRLLVDPEDIRLVFLTGDPALIAARVSARKGHFMPPALLESQLCTLERPAGALTVDVAGTPPDIVAAIRRRLGL